MKAIHLQHAHLGFDGRMFLTRNEWETYLRRSPVRFIKRKKSALCSICGGTEGLLQQAHVIPFSAGVLCFALTPDFLDGEHNIRTAHKGKCNDSCELSLDKVCLRLYEEYSVLALPEFVPTHIHGIWRDVCDALRMG